jgi:hypothetical protein
MDLFKEEGYVPDILMISNTNSPVVAMAASNINDVEKWQYWC